LQLEHLADEAGQKKRTLDSMVTDVLTSQIELDKTAESFRQAHHQREKLIEQWEQTIGQMKKRDGEIEQTAQELMALKVKQHEMDDALHEKQVCFCFSWFS
jgi:predicted  nucleic acid-binding Zn-ribbon protein